MALSSSVRNFFMFLNIVLCMV
jgi:hypothetical protein